MLDTSVLTAAAQSNQGVPCALLLHRPEADFQTVGSVPLFTEYRPVLLRLENLSQRPAPQAESSLVLLISRSRL